MEFLKNADIKQMDLLMLTNRGRDGKETQSSDNAM